MESQNFTGKKQLNKPAQLQICSPFQKTKQKNKKTKQQQQKKQPKNDSEGGALGPDVGALNYRGLFLMEY